MTQESALVSDILAQTPQCVSLLQEIGDIEFREEVSKLGALITYMFENTDSTSGALNRVIVYTLFNCVLKTIDMTMGFLILFNKGIFTSAFSLSRSILELWAAASFAEKTVRDFCTSRNEAELTRIANKLFAGARYPAELPWGDPSTDKPVHINEMLAELERYAPGVGDAYGFLCEYCHPNFLYNMEAYLASKLGAGFNARFRDKFSAVLERHLLSLLQSLRGIKASATAVAEMCLDKYGVDFCTS